MRIGALFGAARDEDVLNGLRAAANGGWSLGDARFKRQITRRSAAGVAPLPKGRPRKIRAERVN